jgi:hypothetical protein
MRMTSFRRSLLGQVRGALVRLSCVYYSVSLLLATKKKMYQRKPASRDRLTDRQTVDVSPPHIARRLASIPASPYWPSHDFFSCTWFGMCDGCPPGPSEPYQVPTERPLALQKHDRPPPCSDLPSLRPSFYLLEAMLIRAKLMCPEDATILLSSFSFDHAYQEFRAAVRGARIN